MYPPPMAPLGAKDGCLCPDSAHIASTYRTLNERASKPRLGDIRHRIGTSSAPRSCCTPPRDSRTMRSQPAWIARARWSASGASASSESVYGAWRSAPAPGAQRSFPPSLIVAIKALACQLPYEPEVPLSRCSLPQIRREVIERGVLASIGQSTLWRWLTEDAIRPWSHRSWIFPRAPAFERKAVRVLDLYHGEWEGRPLSPADCILSTDEKTSIRARRRIHPTLPTAPVRLMRVEHEYQRRGAWAYLAAANGRRGCGPSAAWSPSSCGKSRTDPPRGCSGSWTTAPRTAVKLASSVCSAVRRSPGASCRGRDAVSDRTLRLQAEFVGE